MKADQLREIKANTPTFYPVFEVVNPPDYVSEILNKGTIVYYNRFINVYRDDLNHMNYDLAATHLKFIDYMTMEQIEELLRNSLDS